MSPTLLANRINRAATAAIRRAATTADALVAAALAGPKPGALRQWQEELNDLAVEAYWFLYVSVRCCGRASVD